MNKLRALFARIIDLPIYPVIATAIWVLAIFVDSTAHVTVLARPLLVACAVVTALMLASWAITRRPDVASFYVVLALLVVVGLWIAAFALLAVRVVLLVRHQPHRVVTAPLNVILVLALVLGLANAWNLGALQSVSPPPSGSLTGTGPDVYLILLDGYPRADTLMSDLGFDNSPFLDQMRGLGFEEADRARSNYNLTTLTLASMMNATHVAELPELGGQGRQAEWRSLGAAIDRASALEAYRIKGYEVVSVTSPFSSVSLHAADRLLDRGITELDLQVLSEGLLPYLATDTQRTLLAGALRDRVKGVLNDTVALESDRPMVVLSHVMSPHAPVLFAADGSPVDALPCFPVHCDPWNPGVDRPETREAAVGQIAFLNRLVVAALSQLVARDPEAVIVVFSDHGLRMNTTYHDEMSRALLLARTPGHTGLFPRDATPINILPRILNAYTDGSHALASEETYWTDMVSAAVNGPLRTPSVLVER